MKMFRDYVSAAIALLVIILSGGALEAQLYELELDLDGVLGNGPDTAWVSQGECFDVDVWATGEGRGLYLVQATVCNVDEALDWCGWEVGPIAEECMLIDTLTTVSGPCVTVLGNGGFLFCATSPPFLFATMTYMAAGDEVLASMTIDLGNSIWIDDAYTIGSFVDGISAFVQIGTTAVVESSWGSIKNLFR